MDRQRRLTMQSIKKEAQVINKTIRVGENSRKTLKEFFRLLTANSDKKRQGKEG